MDKKKIKNNLKKAWHFIWNDDSPESWAVNILLAFILIKFLVYPGLGLIFGTNYPIVAVVSGSMEHKTPSICLNYEFKTNKYGETISNCLKYDENYGEICGNTIKKNYFMNFDEYWDTCGDWYNKNTNITKEEFENFKFKNGFNTGDIMILYGTKPEKIKVGDTMVFTTSTRPDPIIHRVIKVWEEDGQLYYQTKGDHNNGINTSVNEGKISKDRYLGRAVLRVPYLGWIKIGFVNSINWIKNLF